MQIGLPADSAWPLALKLFGYEVGKNNSGAERRKVRKYKVEITSHTTRKINMGV